MVVIRLKRGGRTHLPIYTIVAADKRNPRDGRFNEKLGQYNPHVAEGAQELTDVKTDRIKALIGHGAQLSDTVASLLKKNKISLN